MRYTNSGDLKVMRRQAQGPAARANAIRNINQGLAQTPYIGDWMRRGGSMGAQVGAYRGNTRALGCLCGPGDPQFFGALASVPTVKIGPVAARMIALRKAGKTPQYALLDAITQLHSQGLQNVTPEIHLQFAAGLQPITGSLAGFLGSLGLAPVIGAGVTGGSIAGSSVGAAAAGAAGIGSGIALGQTVIPIPVVGAVIGAVVFEAIHAMKRPVGKAEAAWTSPGFYASLSRLNGRDYDEHQFSEAFKGMMDTGNNIIPGCGADRHKDPDCFNQPMAAVIAQGYLQQRVPLSATTAQVFQNVILPWLQSGAGGMVNWANLSKEKIQQQMIMASADRYLADLPVTRGDMASYSNQGKHTPTLLQALAPMLQQPTTTTPQVAGAQAPAPTSQTGYVQPGVGMPTQPGTPYTGGAAVDPTAPPLIYPTTGGGAAPYVPFNPAASPGAGAPVGSQGISTASMLPAGLPSWLPLVLGVIGIGFAFTRTTSEKS